MTIQCCELLARLGDDEVLILDCRTDDEWNEFEFHIPGALHMSLSDLAEHAHVLPDDELIVLCGWDRDGADARRAHRLLQMRGRDALCLEGGLRAWVATGYPTEGHHGDRRVGDPVAEMR